jgi:4-phospho-D-threonate 3-dehydrogenase / 4-phospho-D-erythronate 3-dehydrogenase
LRNAVPKPRIAISMGDPAGIGPELCLRLLGHARVLRCCVPAVFGDAAVLERVAAATGLPWPLAGVETRPLSGATAAAGPSIVDCAAIRADRVKPGRTQAACGRAAYAYIRAAAEAVMAGRAAALVTAPISKEALHAAGVAYPGHTELLTALTGASRVCMMLTAPEITVSLVTTHVSYAKVPSLLNVKRILDVISLTAAAMERMGRPRPRITVCALNPHGGEGGLFGREELRIIGPAVAAAQAAGYRVEGPLPPDTAFTPRARRATDACVVMYHDQGLIPFKTLAFDKGVNVTLGLPIVRTSPDHGTAFDIAWQGKASPSSMIESVRLACRLAAR